MLEHYDQSKHLAHAHRHTDWCSFLVNFNHRVRFDKLKRLFEWKIKGAEHHTHAHAHARTHVQYKASAKEKGKTPRTASKEWVKANPYNHKQYAHKKWLKAMKKETTMIKKRNNNWTAACTELPIPLHDLLLNVFESSINSILSSKMDYLHIRTTSSSSSSSSSFLLFLLHSLLVSCRHHFI